MQVNKDIHSKKRYSSTIFFSNILGRVISLFIYSSLIIFSLFAILNESIGKWIGIPILILGLFWLCESIYFVIKNGNETYSIGKSRHILWKNERKWLFILFFSLNILFVFIAYAAIQRKIYNALI